MLLLLPRSVLAGAPPAHAGPVRVWGAGWEAARDPNGVVYYYSHALGISQYEHPRVGAVGEKVAEPADVDVSGPEGLRLCLPSSRSTNTLVAVFLSPPRSHVQSVSCSAPPARFPPLPPPPPSAPVR
eukprot:3546111-Rhodomonas_salina.1